MGLTPLLVLIETISILIRPVSLAVRLIANIRAGHIIIRLIANASLVARMFFTFFEFFVSLVQSCIFVILLFTYNLNN
jgi:F0F1-type ATP synthase membrane subunit a